jgi:hypothetical protein
MRWKNRQQSLIGAVAIMSIAAGAPLKSSAPPWEGAGVYVFGAYVLDLTKQREVWGPVGNPVRDCSDASYFCLATDPNYGIANFVIPRRCADFKLGEVWSKDGVTTEVLAVSHPTPPPLNPHYSLPDTIYFLGTLDRPHIVYEFWPHDGIVAIYNSLGTDQIASIVQRTAV